VEDVVWVEVLKLVPVDDGVLTHAPRKRGIYLTAYVYLEGVLETRADVGVCIDVG